MAKLLGFFRKRKNEVKLATDESASLKEQFYKWLSKRPTLASPDIYVSCMDGVSEFLKRTKIVSKALWEFVDHEEFSSIYARILKESSFKEINRKIFDRFVETGQLFLEFLTDLTTEDLPADTLAPADLAKARNTPSGQPHGAFEGPNLPSEATIEPPREIERPFPELTLCEALIRVMETARKRMTLAEICDAMASEGDISPWGKQPRDVIRQEIEDLWADPAGFRRESGCVLSVATYHDGTTAYRLIPSGSALEWAPADKGQLTIKEAAVRALEEAHGRGMTAKEVYEKIVDQNWYSFGAKDPQHVVKTQIERGCSGSSRLDSSAEKLFRSETTAEGKIVYYLLSEPSITEASEQPLSQLEISDSETKASPREDPASHLGMGEFVVWLMTQVKATEALDSQAIAQCYVSALCEAPYRLTLNSSSVRNVFACSTAEELSALWATFRCAPDYKHVNHEYGGYLSMGMHWLLRYLGRATRPTGNLPSSATRQNAPPDSPAGAALPFMQKVDFDHPEQFGETYPISCRIHEKAIVPHKQNWSQMLIAIVEHFISEQDPSLASLGRTPLYGMQSFFKKQDGKHRHALLSNGKWIYVNYNTQTIVKIIRNLLRHCGIPLSDVELTCRPNSHSSKVAEKPLVGSHKPKTVDAGISRGIVSIIGERFPNGIRPNSLIDISKLKEYYRNETKTELALADDDIPEIVSTIGIHHENKVYVVSLSTELTLVKLVRDLISAGHKMFFYTEFCEVHADVLRTCHVFSPELFRAVLREIYPSLPCSISHFAAERGVSVESEVLRCYEAKYLTYQQFQEQLPYVGLERIKKVLVDNPRFIWVEPGVYAHLSKIEFDDAECRALRGIVKRAVSRWGHASLASFDVPSSLELNPDLSESAVKTAFFEVYLSDQHAKRGNIVTKKGTSVTITSLLKDYCVSQPRLTMDQLTDFAKEICARGHSQALEVACDNMIRVDKGTFVADSEINFSVNAIDHVLNRLVHNDVIPLQSVKSFTSFPYVNGYRWNLFLLESYCRRFSKRFGFMALSVNSKSVGAIVRKRSSFPDYTEALAYAVALSTVELNVQKVGDYLQKNGYVAVKTKKTINGVIEKARAIRARRI